MTQNQSEALERLRDEVSRLNKELLDKGIDLDRALNDQKRLLAENASLKGKLIDIEKIIKNT